MITELFSVVYGTAQMDQLMGLTTANFRDHRRDTLWIAETRKTLNTLDYKRLDANLQGLKMAVVAMAPPSGPGQARWTIPRFII